MIVSSLALILWETRILIHRLKKKAKKRFWIVWMYGAVNIIYWVKLICCIFTWTQIYFLSSNIYFVSLTSWFGYQERFVVVPCSLDATPELIGQAHSDKNISWTPPSADGLSAWLVTIRCLLQEPLWWTVSFWRVTSTMEQMVGETEDAWPVGWVKPLGLESGQCNRKWCI